MRQIPGERTWIPDVWRAATLDDATLREAWALRATIMDLKPDVDPEADFQAYVEEIRGGEWACLLRDREGAIVGTLFAALIEGEHEGRGYVLWAPEYAMIAPAFRGSPRLAVAALGMYAEAIWRARGRPMFVVGAGYPGGVVTVAAVTDPMWLPGDELPSWEAGLQRRLIEEAGCDSSGVKRMRTIPRAPRLTPPSAGRPRQRAIWEAYAKKNPRWAEGFGLYCFGRITLRSGLLGLVEGARRMWR